MIDEYSLRMDGWARFSSDERLRYRLARLLDPRYCLAVVDGKVKGMSRNDRNVDIYDDLRRVVFLMLNPSTANALKLDPTVAKCVQFAIRWGAQVIEVVNLFALRSSDPRELDRAHARGEALGTDVDADLSILAACQGADRVIPSWGNNGVRHGRDAAVKQMLLANGIKLWHLGTTQDGHPLHPLARGKAFIPLTRELTEWT